MVPMCRVNPWWILVGEEGWGLGYLKQALLGALIRETGWVTKRRMLPFTGQAFFIHWVMQFVFRTLICRTVIYPVDCIIHFLNKQEHLRIFCLVESGNNKQHMQFASIFFPVSIFLIEMQHINLPVPRGSFSCEIVIVIPNCEKQTDISVRRTNCGNYKTFW